MLRKRARSLQKDQEMGPLTLSDSASESHCNDFLGFLHKTDSFFNVPGLFVGLNSPEGMADCDSVRSPTSPLDLRLFSNLGIPSAYKFPRSSQNGHHKCWDCSKVGLSIVNSLDDEENNEEESGIVLKSSESKNILFGQKVRVKISCSQVITNSYESPKSLPRNFAIFPRTNTKSRLQTGCSDVVFEIGEASCEPELFGKVRSCSLDSSKSFSTLSLLANRNSHLNCGNCPSNNVASRAGSPLQFSGGSSDSSNSLHMNLNLPPASSAGGFVTSLSASEIELSEDYTCVITHGPNSKKTHIYGDCILESFSSEKEFKIPQIIPAPAVPIPFPSNNFLSFCHHCNKKLDGSEDIYIYRGEKAFCSLQCRAEEIMIDEEMENAVEESPSEPAKPDNGEELYESGIFDAP